MTDLTAKLYASVAEDNRPREIEAWHASSIAKCPRALYLERLGVAPLTKPGAGKILRWGAGHAIEATIRPHLEKIYPELISNVRFTNKELDLTGEFDAYDPKGKTLISVKSVHDFAFYSKDGRTGLKHDTGDTNTRGNKVWSFKEEPYIHHAWQEHAYVLLMSEKKTLCEGDFLSPRRNLVWPVESIEYVYITLGGLIDTFRTPVNDDILKRVAKKVEYLNKCWKAQELPMCLCKEGQEMWKETNQYCDYNNGSSCCNEDLINMEENNETESSEG